VTLIRATLVGGVTALTVYSFGRPTPVAALVALAAVALCLDAVDGQVARRTGASTPFGARFDMEIDAFLILVLSVHIAVVYGAWIIVIGAMRYAFVAVGWALPWMCAQLPPRQWRKTVAAIEGIVLAVVAAEIVPRAWAMAALVVALALLVESFGRDVVWLRRHVSRGPVETPAPGRLRRTVPRRRSATTAAARTSTPRL
jgi:phosphatidylglycerophosphate synthase